MIERKMQARPRPAGPKPLPPGEPIGEERWCWVREDKNAKVYRTTQDYGPRWECVFRRVVRDTHTGEILEDRDVRGVDDERILYAPIPGAPRDITTRLYHNDPRVDEDAGVIDADDHGGEPRCLG